MTISIVDHMLPDDTHNLYDVNFFSDSIHTIVTDTPSYVNAWISDTQSLHNSAIVGLDVEWRPSYSRNIENPVATLQLCVGKRCLIFQILRAPSVPQPLFDFLANKDYTFVGVGIESDVEKLIGDYDLKVANWVDLRGLAVEKSGNRQLINAGLKNLAKEVLGREIVKPKSVTMSRWDNLWLTPPQVQYACLDAFLSFQIGTTLNAAAASTSASASAPAPAPAPAPTAGEVIFTTY